MDAQTKETIEYGLKALYYLAWIIIPLVVLILGLAFKKPLSHVLMNMKRWKLPWVGEVETKDSLPQVAQKPLESAISEAGPTKAPASPNAPTDPAKGAAGPSMYPVELIEQVINSIQDKLAAAKVTGQARENLLIEWAGDGLLAASFERTYRMIFGSQMEALLLANGAGGVSADALRTMFDNAKQRFPNIHSTRTFEQWVGFILAQSLIEVTPGSDGKFFRILPYGRGYLHYFVSAQLQPKYAEVS